LFVVLLPWWVVVDRTLQPRDMNGGVGGSGGGGGSSGSGTGGLTERARGAVYAGPPRRTIGNDDAIFDHENPKIKEVLKP
jgi:hypothetical protein